MVFAAKLPACFDALPAEVGFQAPRLVIDTGVNYTAVVAGLVISGACLLFQQQNAGARLSPAQFEAACGANDAGADNDEVVFQLRLQTDEAFSIGDDWTQPSWSMEMVLARDSAPLWQMWNSPDW